MRRLCDVTDARRILNPGPVAIVTTSWRGITNAAPIAWLAPLSMEPPLVGCVIHPHRHTADMIRFSEAFAINIPGPALLKHTAFFGSQTGLNTNKIEASGLEVFNPLAIDAPLLEGCLAWIECTVQDVIRTGDHTLFVGNVVKVQADDEAYAQQWLLNDREHSPLTFIGGTRYAVIGDPMDAVVEVDINGGLIVETAEERERREELEAQEREKRRLEGEEGFDQMKRAEEADHKTQF
ncbi:MAG: flavin reductase family protein [Chloroflexi bacterium]|nr:flavin reductase family protein [Chloroflexota bacterium]MCZ7578970.1 flavin reductase family protein [Dehalococcoidia bacterium]